MAVLHRCVPPRLPGPTHYHGVVVQANMLPLRCPLIRSSVGTNLCGIELCHVCVCTVPDCADHILFGFLDPETGDEMGSDEDDRLDW